VFSTQAGRSSGRGQELQWDSAKSAAFRCNFCPEMLYDWSVVFEGILGMSAGREVFLGFAPANILHSLSFADVLDEDTGRGYQRRFNASPQH
jgi:hypothetical protein